MCRRDPGADRVARLFGQLKLNRLVGLLPRANRAASDLTALDGVVHAETDQVAGAQLALNGEIE